MSDYKAVYTRRFQQNLRRYSGMRKQIKQRVERILDEPYANTEELSDYSAKLNLIGCRSIRVDRNFRILFAICEECRDIAECAYCFCDEQEDETVIFLTVGPHDRAYAMR